MSKVKDKNSVANMWSEHHPEPLHPETLDFLSEIWIQALLQIYMQQKLERFLEKKESDWDDKLSAQMDRFLEKVYA